jgi:hypothetical protein
MTTHDIEKARWVNEKVHELAARVDLVRDKTLVLRDAVVAVTDEDITAEAIDVRTPQPAAADPKTKPPGDYDTTDPWIVKDGTADWDVNDPIH